MSFCPFLYFHFNFYSVHDVGYCLLDVLHFLGISPDDLWHSQGSFNSGYAHYICVCVSNYRYSVNFT